MDFARGDATGVAMPAHPRALVEAGPDFLTRAFRAFGSLGEDNAVTRIVAAEPVLAGNSGEKLRLTVDYAKPGPDRELFAKFSRYFPDPFRDRRRAELEAEVRLAELSRHPAFPVTVAKAWFADFHAESGTGILISQAIAIGEGGVLPMRAKCMDHELLDAPDHYRATVGALAKLAAACQTGQLSPEVERLFPYDRTRAEADIPVPWDAAQLRAKAAALRDFIAAAPQLFPARVAEPQFLARLEGDVLLFLAREAEIRRFLHADPGFVALAHWNTNLDNAWFWRDSAGVLQCGLLDWGMVRVMNVAWGIWGGMSAAEPQLWDDHGDALLAHFADVLAAEGGPRLAPERLRLHLDLSVIILGLGMMMDLPALALSRLPEVVQASGPHDPLLRRDQVVHGFLHVTTNFLNLWASHDFARSIETALD